ncbi:class I SAM-dependent DNA methyltransferase [bacterium]|nr:class I SAM-dependent DNA methyltransferase [bacterium]
MSKNIQKDNIQNSKDLKTNIKDSINNFSDKNDLSGCSTDLFKILGYESDRKIRLSEKTYSCFKETIIKQSDKKFDETKALVNDWIYADFLFQMTKDEVVFKKELFKEENKFNKLIIESYLFFVVDLKKSEYSRTALSQITREINKIFMIPLLVLFRYGDKITISIIHRRVNKKEKSKDVLEKVTLIKDIDIKNPHRAHIEILFDLSFEQLKTTYQITNFIDLHNAWQKTLDLKELNKKFYKELSNWYFWAIKEVQFPDDKKIENSNEQHVIRLLTRLIFVWFLKEKQLIPETIFNKNELNKIIKGFNEKNSTVYYQAILQNLFFATLNQKIEDRDFALDKKNIYENKGNYGVNTLYRYEEFFNISLDEVKKLFAETPFLNGGLFDCLDYEDENKRKIYVDGFSRNDKKRAKILDSLFFSEEFEKDLSKDYGDSKNKNEKIKGLFEIFNHYKFTIEENTPIEEEIALDPELLGKVFENLLASYNPETETTARKQTGSFYTPREIVDYMVDESLKSYFKQKLIEEKNSFTEKEIDDKLDDLFQYNNNLNLFDENENIKNILINAIDSCKILDPACGSGAFPMGILHKLVFILHKLDPKNRLWKNKQIQKVDELINKVNIDDSNLRDKIVSDLEANKKDIEESFENNELDYGRKLYLIENCIYGVDIQPIAIQISKLRFFISLIVDQKVDRNKDNFGVRSLPNLETKFVCANSLIGIEKPQIDKLSFDIEFKKLENELKDVRHRLFSVKNRNTKLKYQSDDKNLREKIAIKLKDSLIKDNIEKINELNFKIVTFKNELENIKPIIEITSVKNLYGEIIEKKIDKTKEEKQKIKKYLKESEDLLKKLNNLKLDDIISQLASWNPYNQNSSSNFFDPEWMFGINNGFDIVIGNPPYVRQEKIKDIKPLLEKKYSCYNGVADLFIYFYELGYNILKNGGALTFITSNKWTRAKYGKEFREFILKNTTISNYIDFNGVKVFENATVDTSIFIFYKDKDNFLKKENNVSKEKNFLYCSVDGNYKGENLSHFVFEGGFSYNQSDLTAESFSFANVKELEIKKKIEKVGTPLKDWDININYGIKTGFNEAFIISTQKKEEILNNCKDSIELEKTKNIIKPVLRGRDIKKYSYEWSDLWILFIPWHFPNHQEKNNSDFIYNEKCLKDNYPSLYNHLLSHKEKLSARNQAETGIRYEWYCLQRFASDYYQEFEKEKIFYNEIGNTIEFVSIKEKIYCNNKLYFITLQLNNSLLIKYFVSLFNSKTLQFYFSLIFNFGGGKGNELFQYIPIPQVSEEEQKPFVVLVEKILAEKKNNPNANTTELEKQIDELVYELYGLTEDEIKIVEG